MFSRMLRDLPLSAEDLFEVAVRRSVSRSRRRFRQTPKEATLGPLESRLSDLALWPVLAMTAIAFK